MEEKKFTDEDLLNTLREFLWPQYKKYTAIQGLVEFEDIVQDCALGFYENMKFKREYIIDEVTGEKTKKYINTPFEEKITRIDYYRNAIDPETGKPMYSWKHIRNIVRMCTYQCIPNWLKSNMYKYNPLSLNNTLNDEDKTEWIDLVPSLDEDLLLQAELEDIRSTLSPDQKAVVDDVLAGYTKTSLREKYKRFDYIIEEVRDKIEYYYRRSVDVLPSEIEERKYV